MKSRDISAGIDVNLANEKQEDLTALLYALQEHAPPRYIEVVNLVLEAPGIDVHKKDEGWHNFAAAHGQIEAVRKLLDFPGMWMW